MENPLTLPSTWDLAAEGYAAEAVPLLTPIAADALRLVDAPSGGRILDVACGPGTLALQAAKTAARVDAVDFSPAMIAKLTAVAPANVFPRVGDGQALPYEAASFDAAFSIFGVIFFPGPAKPLPETAKVAGSDAACFGIARTAQIPQRSGTENPGRVREAGECAEHGSARPIQQPS